MMYHEKDENPQSSLPELSNHTLIWPSSDAALQPCRFKSHSGAKRYVKTKAKVT